MSVITNQQRFHINKYNTNKSLIGPHRYNVLSVPIPGGMTLRNCEVALSELNLYNSIFNISAALGNNKITVMYASTTLTGGKSFVNGYVFTIPDGLYQISDLNDWLQTALIAAGLYSTISGVVTTFISFAYNPIYLKVQLTTSPLTGGTPGTPLASGPGFTTWGFTFGTFLSGGAPMVLFSDSTGLSITTGPSIALGEQSSLLSTVVGSNPLIPIPSTTYDGSLYTFNTTTTTNTLPFIPQDTSYNTVLVTCNLVASSVLPQYNNVIYDFAPSIAASGRQLSFAPFEDFLDCVDGFYNVLTITFVDENESPVPIEDPTMSVTVLVRPKQLANLKTDVDLGNVKSLGSDFVPPPNEDDVNIVPSTRLQPKRPRFDRTQLIR